MQNFHQKVIACSLVLFDDGILLRSAHVAQTTFQRIIRNVLTYRRRLTPEAMRQFPLVVSPYTRWLIFLKVTQYIVRAGREPAYRGTPYQHFIINLKSKFFLFLDTFRINHTEEEKEIILWYSSALSGCFSFFSKYLLTKAQAYTILGAETL